MLALRRGRRRAPGRPRPRPPAITRQSPLAAVRRPRPRPRSATPTTPSPATPATTTAALPALRPLTRLGVSTASPAAATTPPTPPTPPAFAALAALVSPGRRSTGGRVGGAGLDVGLLGRQQFDPRLEVGVYLDHADLGNVGGSDA